MNTSHTYRKFIILAITINFLFITNGNTQTFKGEDLNPALQPLLEKHNVPALAAAVVKDGKIIAAGAVGYRIHGEKYKVTLQDKFHIGSCTKSMTATLAAMYVEENKLSWDLTLDQAFPRFKNKMTPDYQKATLRQLLSHRAGVPYNINFDGLWTRLRKQAFTMKPFNQRKLLFETVIQKPLENKPGIYHYSNAGYAIAGHIIERIEKKPWETIITNRLFKPLNMTSAGFGAPCAVGKHDQPWGHQIRDGKVIHVKPGLYADNPPAIGPAGTVHCNILDFAKYANFHLIGQNKGTPLLPKNRFIELHTPAERENYALGWGVLQRNWGGGTVLSHNGTNTTFFAVMWLAPKKNFAVVVATNTSKTYGAKACDDVASMMIQTKLK